MIVRLNNLFSQFSGFIRKNFKIQEIPINFVERNGEVKGYSVTDIGGEHETRSNIFGEYDKEKKILNFREVGIVYTKSTISQNDFCFLNTSFKNFVFGKTKKVKANFNKPPEP